MENLKDTNVVQDTTNSQEDIDNAVASAKARWNKKLEKDYVSIEKYNEVLSQLTQAQNELKLPKLEQAFVQAGGKKEAFNHFVKLNGNLFEAKDEKEINNILAEAKKEYGYMFNPQSFNASVGGSVKHTDDKIDYTNGSLLRTK